MPYREAELSYLKHKREELYLDLTNNDVESKSNYTILGRIGIITDKIWEIMNANKNSKDIGQIMDDLGDYVVRTEGIRK